MIGFENFLIEQGYSKHYYDSKNKKYVLTNEDNPSSMGNVFYSYLKGNHKIDIGLNEKNKPVTLIYPRPKITMNRIINGITWHMDENLDDTMNVALSKICFETIHEAMFDDSIVLEINLS